ncbi:MAG: hypothetical protein ACRCXD_03415 [Luteolibacter sp.]
MTHFDASLINLRCTLTRNEDGVHVYRVERCDGSLLVGSDAIRSVDFASEKDAHIFLRKVLDGEKPMGVEVTRMPWGRERA